MIIAVDSLGAGEEVTGYLNAATGIGGILAGVLAGWIVLCRLDLPILGASLVGAAGIAILGVTRNVPSALVAIGVAVGALLVLDVINATILQRAVPDEERGRAMGLLQVSSSVAAIAGAFALPTIAGSLSVGVALIVSAIGGTVLAMAAVIILQPTGVLAPSSVDQRRIELLRASSSTW